MPSHDSSERSSGSASFACDWRSEGIEAASVHVSGELDLATAPRLGAVLLESLRHARLVLVNLEAMTFMDLSGVHVIADAAAHALKTGRRLVLVEVGPQPAALLAMTAAHIDVDVLNLRPDADEPPCDRILAQRARARAVGAVAPIDPLDNPVNARVVMTRAMAVPDLELWLQSADGAIYRAWAPPTRDVIGPGTTVEVYLDARGAVNGWWDPQSGLAVNQRRMDSAKASAVAGAAVCQGECGVVWRAPAARELADHRERCLTCAGPLVLG
jgi:anti-sigma B factor antagonist